MERTKHLFLFALLACVMILGLMILAGCSSSSNKVETSNTETSQGEKIMKWTTPPPMTIDQNKTYEATIKTNYGDIIVQLLPKEAPLAVNNFVFLSRQKFYDGVKFHRIIKGFMMQGGDPTGTGAGGPGYKFADEPVTRKPPARWRWLMPGRIPMAASSSSCWPITLCRPATPSLA